MNQIIVSNRVVTPDAPGATAGGLAPALMAAVQRSGATWIGGSGKLLAAGEPARAPSVKRLGAGRLVTVDLPEADYRHFYNGMANSALWPLLHDRLDLLQYRPGHYDAYRRINHAMAEHVAHFTEHNAAIWIHDYHYFMLARFLRRRGIGCPIGFFLHTPFPARSLMAAMPAHKPIVGALLDCDLIGFQTPDDRQRFADYAANEIGAHRVGDGELLYDERQIRLGVYPVGIDVERFVAAAASSPPPVGMRRAFGDSRIVIGVDRLDYSKGLPLRLTAYKRLLEHFPDLRHHTSFLQITPPTRGEIPAYQQLRMELAALVGDLNGRFGDINWMPMHYLNDGFPPETLAAYYRQSKVGCVTPLRDGMNLVAKEYVAAQDPEDPGVLVLSRFAGAAHELTAALQVNPYDTEEMARQLHFALRMRRDERIERWKSLMSAVRGSDVATWYDSFMTDLAGPVRKPKLVSVRSVA
jgi:trehalose 6-phosphate synthase